MSDILYRILYTGLQLPTPRPETRALFDVKAIDGFSQPICMLTETLNKATTNKEQWIHCPLIAPLARDPSTLNRELFALLPRYTHLLFTSKTAVSIFCSYLSYFGFAIQACNHLTVIAIGTKTAEEVLRHGLPAAQVAAEETGEGVVTLLSNEIKEAKPNIYFFWPRAAHTRAVLPNFFHKNGIRYHDCTLYDTCPIIPDPLPDLTSFDAIFFTSPSGVDSFFHTFGCPPPHLALRTIGPVTAAHLERLLSEGELRKVAKSSE